VASRTAVWQALHPDATVELAIAPRTIPYFEDTFVYCGQTYRYAMAGANPKTSQGTTRIPTIIVPLRFVFADGHISTLSKTIVVNVRRSPLFRPAEFTSGMTQYGDAIQRAEFWTHTQSTGYHVLLRRPVVTATAVILGPRMPRPAAPAGATSPGPVSFDHADWRVPNAREPMGPARISDPASHPFFDDFGGRLMGATIGRGAFALAQQYYAGTVTVPSTSTTTSSTTTTTTAPPTTTTSTIATTG